MGSKRITKEEIVFRLKELHPELEFPSAEQDFKTVADYTTVVCRTHGDSSKSFENLLYNKTGCKSCGAIKANTRNLKPIQEFLGKLEIIGVEVVEEKSHVYRSDDISVKCPKHGVIKRNLKTSLRYGVLQCPSCARASSQARAN
jgi:thioredoxin-related protein